MKSWIIDHPQNEASALLGIQNPRFLAAHGWETGFWIASDERPAHKALAALGRNRTGEWEVLPLHAKGAASSKRCEDCETISRAGSRVYVFGSQYGTKEGPLEPKRHFVARFNEAFVDVENAKRPAVHVDLVRRPFALHRIVNDALQEHGIALFPVSRKLHDAFVRQPMERKRRWSRLVKREDCPINVEGSAFLEGGRLLLGLRFPVTREGHPILIELEGIDRLFEEDQASPHVVAVRVLTNVGNAKKPAGIRELDSRGGVVHAITGALDDELLGRSPRLRRAHSEHWAYRHVYGSSGLQEIEARRILRFGPRARIEGMALDGAHVWYIHDDEKIRLEQGTLESQKA